MTSGDTTTFGAAREHYRQAEKLLREAEYTDQDNHERYCLAAAQIHASLALVAATVEAADERIRAGQVAE